MLSGHVSDTLEATITLRIEGPVGGRTVSAAVDTGFDGSLSLPQQVIVSLGLEYRDRTIAQLADGSLVSMSRYTAVVRLGDDQSRRVLVIESDGGPLIGMSLLLNSTLTVEIWPKGKVTITPRFPAEPGAGTSAEG